MCEKGTKMIRFASVSDYGSIMEIWNNAFGDSFLYIKKFLSFFGEHSVVSVNDGEVDGIMSLLPVFLNNKNGRYIYAVAVSPKKQGQGIGKELIEFAKENSEDFCVLVPADEGLFNYYRKLGFSDNSYVAEYEEIEKEKEISPKEYLKLRDKYFDGKNYIKWNEEQLLKIASLYDAKFYKNKESTEISMLSKDRIIECLGEKEPSGKRLFSMIFPDEFKNSYFNIALD